MLRAGLEGIKQNYSLPEPIEKNIYALSEEEKKKLGIESLPGSLGEAIEYAEKSELLRDTLGEHIFNQLMALKKAECDEYRIQVTEYELAKYLPIL